VPGTKFPPGIFLRYYFNPLFFNNFPAAPTFTREREPEAPNPALNHINNLQPKNKYRSKLPNTKSVPVAAPPPNQIIPGGR